MAGWNDSRRRETLPPDWPARRAKQLKLDGGRCTWRLPSGKRCPRTATDVDHKREGHPELNEPGRDLQSLCEAHHQRKTAVAARTFKRAKVQKGRRPPERHPGLVS